MAVPAHDQRDFEFAKEYGLPIIVTITPQGKPSIRRRWKPPTMMTVSLVNSGHFNGMKNREAILKHHRLS